MTLERETVGKQFGFSTTVPGNHLQFFIQKEARLSAQLCFQPNRMLWDQMGKSFSRELFRFPQYFWDIFPPSFSQRQLSLYSHRVCMGRRLPEFEKKMPTVMHSTFSHWPCHWLPLPDPLQSWAREELIPCLVQRGYSLWSAREQAFKGSEQGWGQGWEKAI